MTPPTPPNPDGQNDGWHLDKRIPIATLMTMVSVVLVGVMHIAEIRKDVEVLRENQSALSSRITKQELDTSRAMDRFYTEVRDVNAKLDRLIEGRK